MKKLFLLLLLLIPAQTFAAIAADAYTACRANPATTCTVAHTVTGANTGMSVMAFTFPSLASINGCTVNGAAMTPINRYSDATDNRTGFLFYKIAPATGNIVCTINASTIIYHSDESYTGTVQTAQPTASSSSFVHIGTTLSTTVGGLTVTVNRTDNFYINLICMTVDAVTGNTWALCGAVDLNGSAINFTAGANTVVRGTDPDGSTGIADSNNTTPVVTATFGSSILLMTQGIFRLTQGIFKMQ